ncbi:MAG: hypothetical protein MUF49_09935 [Oculatellaceae cyanobacterium Prado106]|jgi:hypothetical protein|nr:hypothetical protein [Oculatellaceae cyanobacterium Prado106]
MTAREQLLQELTEISDELVEEVLDFLLFAKSRKLASASESPTEDEDDQPKAQVLESLRRSLQDAKAGRTRPVSELWEGIDVE